VVKVIWQKTASPPQMDGSIVFARLGQCALPCGHIGTIWRIRLNLCFLRSTWVHNPKWQIDRFRHFCTAHCRKSLYFTIFPKIHPSHRDLDRHLIHDSLGPSEPINQTASRSAQPLLHRWLQSVPILYNEMLIPTLKNAHCHSGI